MTNPYILQLKLRWKLILNNRKLTAIILILPLLLSIGLGSIFRDYSSIDRIPVALIDEDQTEQSRKLMDALYQLESLDVTNTSFEDASRQLSDNRIEAIFTIESGYEKMILSGNLTSAIEITFLESNMVASALGDIVAREVIQEFVVHSAGLKAGRLLDSEQAQATAMERTQKFITDNTFELKINQLIQVPGNDRSLDTQSSVSTQELMRNRIVIGMMLASTSFFMIFIGSSTIEERKQAAFQRLKCAGHPRITGAYLGFFTFALCLLSLQSITLNFVLKLFPWSSFITQTYVLAGFASSLCGIMLFTSTWFEKSSVFQSLSAPAVFFVCLAGGAFWSLELIPSNLLLLSKITPIYWTMEALMNISFGSGVNIIAVGLLLLSGPLLSRLAEQRV